MPTILVADDNSNIQKMVSLALKDQGIDVVSVGNGEAAVRKLPEVLPDLVLADIFMPVRNGYEVCEFVKQDPRFAHTPVVLLVGAFDPLDEHEAQRVGADGVLKKPFVPPDPLITMVKSLLARSASEPLVPVAAGAAPAVAEFPVPSEPRVEELPPVSSPAAHLVFNPGETPLAFGELLETPTTEAEPEPEAPSPREAGFGGMRFWEILAATEEPAAEQEEPAWSEVETSLPRCDQGAALWPVESNTEQPEVVEEPVVAQEVEVTPKQEEGFAGVSSQAIPDEEEALADAAVEQATVPETVEAVPVADAVPSETAPRQPLAEFPALASFAEMFASTSRTAEASDPAPSAPVELPKEELVPAWESPPEPHVAAEPAPSEAVQSFAVPPPPDPALVEAVVARVLERMQPRIMEIVTKEILKPVVEALVRRELEKN